MKRERRKLVERHWVGQCPERPFPPKQKELKRSSLRSVAALLTILDSGECSRGRRWEEERGG